MELAKKRMFLWMLNSGIRPSEAARRVVVECGGVNPMTVDREEREGGGRGPGGSGHEPIRGAGRRCA